MWGTRQRNGARLAAVGGAALAVAFGVATASATAGSAAPGNNGTIKVADVTVDGIDDSDISNHPHLGADFAVRWFGFDAGTRTTTVSFAAQPPSGTGTVPVLAGSTSFTFEGTGTAGALDHTETYRLDTTGLTEQPNQGYHVKVTVTVDGAQGNDTKSKTFWVAKAEPTPSPTPTVTPTVTPTETPTETPTATPSESISPSVLPTKIVRSPSVSPSVKGVKIVKRLPRTGPGPVGPLTAAGVALVLVGAALMWRPASGTHTR